MKLIAEISSWVGLALLALSICAAVGALLALPFITLSARGARQAIQNLPTPKSTNLNDALMGFSWAAWPLFALLTVWSSFREDTRYADAGFGFVYITLGMPAFLAAWLGLNICACIRPVRTSWLFAWLLAAALIVVGFANINKP